MDTVAILSDLIALDTTSHLSNRPLLNYVIDILRRHQVEPLLIWNTDHSKANLWATIGPIAPGGIILSAHTDTVPVDGQVWTSDPFRLDDRVGDRVYGRGSCDMKGFIASVLAAVPKLVEANLKRPIHLSLSYDEEIGCVGVLSLVEHLKANPVGAAFCIVGEPTDMQPVIGHKGGRSYKVRVHGSEAHSSLAPQAVNAIEYAAELITFLRSVAGRMREGAHDDLYDVPHSTLSTGIIHGGSAINIVPRSCEFTFEFRFLREIAPEAIMDEIRKYANETLLPQMRVIAPEADITFENIYDYPWFAIDPHHELVTLTKNWAGSNTQKKVAYGTEAGHFSESLRIPTIVCGPGSIEQAHKPDEYITREQLRRCDSFLGQVVSYLS
jgi:acetylornithine deacetylase